MRKGSDIDGEGSSVVLSHDDPPPFTVVNAGAGGDFLIVCDHAGRRIPERLGSLGLPATALERHIAWDIGAVSVATCLAKDLGVPAVLQTYSRLVIDCNRAPAHEDSIPTVSDDHPIPGNAGLRPADVRARLREIFEPYHQAIGRELKQAGRPAVISLHSFTPTLAGVRRPWSYGVLHDGESLFCRAMLELLQAEFGAAVGDNEPYAMDGTDFTVPYHAMRNELDYLELEIRQDLITEPEEQVAVAAMLARLLPLARARSRLASPAADD